MQVPLCLLFFAVTVLANTNDNRRNNLPFIADAVGNTLPPPSNVPATVGSPVNLLTPDRYEFYTFDESGELVKRLMTLEEIQAIVAAGEDPEGLVTFANDDQPTMAFNVNPPPYTKVHSVVANVQNVLKAQMEAYKNKPPMQPTLDTPDVSDSWSLILPSIFGNTGVEITPDKSTGTVTTPDTETLEEQFEYDENSLSKEGDSEVFSSSATKQDEKVIVTEKVNSKTTEAPISTPQTTSKLQTTSQSPTITTKKPVILTTAKPTPATSTTRTTISSTQTKINNKLHPTTAKYKPTTSKPLIRTTNKITTPTTEVTTKKYALSISSTMDNENNIQIHPNSNTISSTEKHDIKFEKISTFIPVSTVTYVTKHTTQTPLSSTKLTPVFASTTKRSIMTTNTSPTMRISTAEPPVTTNRPTSTTLSSSTLKQQNDEKINITTITSQSISPSTIVSSTEFLTFDKVNSPDNLQKNPNIDNSSNIEKYDETLPLFDVAQSISQIASDLGGNYQPVPTTSDLLDSTIIDGQDLESKENVDVDIPSVIGNETNIKVQDYSVENKDNFVKISTLDPHNANEDKQSVEKNTAEDKTKENKNNKTNIVVSAVQKVDFTSSSSTSEPTTIDPILFESMGDVMSQVVNETPSIINSDTKNESGIVVITTEKIATSSTAETINDTKIESEKLNKIDKIVLTSTEKAIQNSKINNNNLVTKNDSNYVSEIKNKESIHSISNLKHDEILVYNKTIAENEHTFVQLSGSTNSKNDEKDKIKDYSTSIYKEETTQIPDFTTAMEESTSLEPVITDMLSTESTTVLSGLNNHITSVAIKTNNTSQIIKSNFNDTINVTIKKEKQPDLLPKLDDIKKKIQKVNIDDEELMNERNNTWKLIPTVSPPKANEIPKDKIKSENHYNADSNYNKDIVLEFSSENQGLEVTTKYLEEDVARFTELSNELAFRYWNLLTDDIDKRRSFVFSPYSTFSMLAMIFMGAKGATSGEMNEILKLDDMVTFNPHFTLKNVSDSIETSAQSGVAVSAFIRELYSDRNKGKILTFYKERAQHFYNGHVEEVNFKLISDIIRRRTNLLVKRYTWGKIPEYMKTNNIVMEPPLAAFTANIFQTDCTGTSVDGRDGEMYFVVSPNVRQRRLVPVPAVVYKKGFLAGYDPVLDVTVAALGNTNTVISTLFLMPGQQGNVVHADDLEKLEQRLLEAAPTTPTWNRILRTLLPRIGLELQIPRFSHKSTFNASLTLKKMGLRDLFDGEHADLGGLNGPSKDLYLSDMIQINTFVTCGEGIVGEQHHIEEYPENIGAGQRRRARWLNDWDEPRDYQRAFHDPHDFSDAMNLPLHLRPRQARLPVRSTQPARLKYDRPFIYFVRHNPSGIILYFGRYNPRLLP